MKSKLVIGRYRRPDIGVEVLTTPGKGLAVEVGSPPSFDSAKKIGQLQQDASAISRGLVLGNAEQGPLEVTESFRARGLPIVGVGGNVPTTPCCGRLNAEVPAVKAEPPPVSESAPLERTHSGAGTAMRIVSAFGTAAVLTSDASTSEKAKALVEGYAVSEVTGAITNAVVGGELAEILGGPIGFVIGMCGDNANSCRDQAMAEARADMLKEINGRAYWIMMQTMASGSPADYSVAYGMAVHEKYVELGLSTPRRDCDPTQACCANTPLRLTLEPHQAYSGPQMYSR